MTRDELAAKGYVISERRGVVELDLYNPPFPEYMQRHGSGYIQLQQDELGSFETVREAMDAAIAHFIHKRMK